MKAIECSNTTDSGFDSGLVVFLSKMYAEVGADIKMKDN